MKKILGALLLLAFCGCTSINVPNYIQDKYPYKKMFYAPFDRVYPATVKALEDSGWTVEEETDPALFELGREVDANGVKQTLVFTKIRQFSFFLGSQYTRLNAYLRVTPDKAVEVEIRYLRITSTMFKAFNKFRNDRAVDRIFKRIEQSLNAP